MSKTEAAARYTAIKAPYVGNGDDFNALYDGDSTDVTAWKAACGEVAVAYDGFSRGLAAETRWPTDVQPKIDALVSAYGVSRGFYVQCEESVDMSQVYDAIGRRTGDLAGAIQNVQIVLGLPSS